MLLSLVWLVISQLIWKEIPNLTLGLLFGNPGQIGMRCNSNLTPQWQLLKGLKKDHRNPDDRDLIRVEE